jgi:hypothetical protein
MWSLRPTPNCYKIIRKGGHHETKTRADVGRQRPPPPTRATRISTPHTQKLVQKSANEYHLPSEASTIKVL